MADENLDINNLNKLRVVDLRERLTERGLPTSGLKAELIKRLREAILNESSQQPDDESNDLEPDEENVVIDDPNLIPTGVSEFGNQPAPEVSQGDFYNEDVNLEYQQVPLEQPESVINYVEYSSNVIEEQVIMEDQEIILEEESKRISIAEQERVAAEEQQKIWQAEQERLAAEEQQKLWKAEQERSAAEERQKLWEAEQVRLAAEKQQKLQKAEQERLAAEEQQKLLKAEQERQAAEEQQKLWKAEQERLAAEEQQRLWKAEQERLAAEEKEKLWIAEQERQAAEEQEKLWKAEQERLAAEEQEKLWKAEQERLAAEEQEKLRKAEQERLAAEEQQKLWKAEQKRLQIEEQQRQAEEEERQRLLEQKKIKMLEEQRLKEMEEKRREVERQKLLEQEMMRLKEQRRKEVEEKIREEQRRKEIEEKKREEDKKRRELEEERLRLLEDQRRKEEERKRLEELEQKRLLEAEQRKKELEDKRKKEEERIRLLEQERKRFLEEQKKKQLEEKRKEEERKRLLEQEQQKLIEEQRKKEVERRREEERQKLIEQEKKRLEDEKRKEEEQKKKSEEDRIRRVMEERNRMADEEQRRMIEEQENQLRWAEQQQHRQFEEQRQHQVRGHQRFINEQEEHKRVLSGEQHRMLEEEHMIVEEQKVLMGEQQKMLEKQRSEEEVIKDNEHQRHQQQIGSHGMSQSTSQMPGRLLTQMPQMNSGSPFTHSLTTPPPRFTHPSSLPSQTPPHPSLPMHSTSTPIESDVIAPGTSDNLDSVTNDITSDIKLPQALEKVLALKTERAQLLGVDPEAVVQPLPVAEYKESSQVAKQNVVTLVVVDEDETMREESATKSKESKGRRRKKKKKKKQQLRFQQDEGQKKKTEPPKETSIDIDIEYVQDVLDVTDPLYSHFVKIFEKFKLNEADKEKETQQTDSVKIPSKDENVNPLALRKKPMDIDEDDDDDDRDDDEKKEDDKPKLSKRKLKKLSRMSVAELKQKVIRPELVEMHDVTAKDPILLLHLKASRNTVPVPRHWCFKRKYLQGKRGIEKPAFELPDFIKRTGIMEMRQALQEKEDQKSMKAKMRERVRPKMGKIDIDYQKLHDAFFKWQTKPRMTIHGDLYYEGKEFETRLKEKKPGDLSEDLRTALGMPTGPNANKCPPPWLIAMQRYGPPPSYPNLKIPGLNAPIPDSCSFGYHAGGWGKPPVDETGRPLYGDVFGTQMAENQPQIHEEEIDHTLWGELESESSEEEGDDDDDEEDEEEEEEKVEDETGLVTPAEGLITPSGFSSIPAGMETPDMIELRKRKIEAEMEGGETPALYTILPEKKNERIGASMMGSTHIYDLAAAIPAGKIKLPGTTSVPPQGIEVALDPSELELDTAAMAARYEQTMREQQSQLEKEDLSDMVAEHAARQKNKRKKQQMDSAKPPKKYKEFKF